MQERRVTTRLLTLCPGVGEEAVRNVLEIDLQKRKIFFEVCGALLNG
jgi:hypothetical protein